ncbi:MAG: hypothetical protein RJB25_611, partial [Bacteroidota bacterium]
MQLTKLNADSSWMFYFDGLHVLVDPWFTESQVDFHPWFSRQFHIDEQPRVAVLHKPDFIFISHRYTDHCNRETLLQFSSEIPVVAIDSILNLDSVSATIYPFSYPDQKEFPPPNSNLYYDAESISFFNDSLWIFTKC